VAGNRDDFITFPLPYLSSHESLYVHLLFSAAFVGCNARTDGQLSIEEAFRKMELQKQQ
jgi:hypothetical protein